jgi:hypothetical protein
MAKPIEIVIANHGTNLGWAVGLESIITEYSTSDNKTSNLKHRPHHPRQPQHHKPFVQRGNDIDSFIDLLHNVIAEGKRIKDEIGTAFSLLETYEKTNESHIGTHKIIRIENNTNLCEANHFLTHIINEYDNLADITIFLQGYPLDHSPNFTRNVLLNLGSEFCTIPKSEPSTLEKDDHGQLAISFSDVIGRKTRESCWSAGGQFMASSNAIRKNPIEWYQIVLEKAKEFKDAKFALERLWHVVITGETK